MCGKQKGHGTANSIDHILCSDCVTNLPIFLCILLPVTVTNCPCELEAKINFPHSNHFCQAFYPSTWKGNLHSTAEHHWRSGTYRQASCLRRPGATWSGIMTLTKEGRRTRPGPPMFMWTPHLPFWVSFVEHMSVAI